MKNLQKITLLLFLGVLFSINVQAIGTTANTACNVETSCVEYEAATTCLEDAEFKDGKWKERLKAFLEGVMEGILKGMGGIANGGGSNGGGMDGFSQADLDYLADYSLTNLQTEGQGAKMISDIQLLILSEDEYAPASELAAVFNNDQQINGMFASLYAPYGEYNSDTNLYPAVGPFWKGAGKVVGYIIGIFIKDKFP